MPDWSYHPILRPWLFHLAPDQAHQITLSVIGKVAERRLGGMMFHLVGHMTPPETIGQHVWGMDMPSPIGIGNGLDADGQAVAAFSRFGAGFLELGPVTLTPIDAGSPLQRHVATETLAYPDIRRNRGAQALVHRLRKLTAAGVPLVPIGVRLGYAPGADVHTATAERCTMIELLREVVAFFTLAPPYQADKPRWTIDEWGEHMKALLTVNQQGSLKHSPPLLLCIHPDDDQRYLTALIEQALRLGVQGVVIDDGMWNARSEHRWMGPYSHNHVFALIQYIRTTWGDSLVIIANGGIHQPAEALALLKAGASLCSLHSGLVFSGPGLVKRINEALAYHRPSTTPATPTTGKTFGLSAWKWAALLALGLGFANLLIWLVALTRVLLPYDEAFVGMNRAQLEAINPYLLPFMTHDRVVLAGTVLSSAIIYLGLAVFGIRLRLHWATSIVRWSAGVGFLSFLLFLGFGYFDPVHAMLSVGLLPMFYLGIRGGQVVYTPNKAANLHNSRQWLLSQWGQLMFVVVGMGFLLGGLSVVVVGLIHVFVPQDLDYLRTTADTLAAINPRLLPLIAHDRVGFGGALVSNGLAVLLLSLWGFRQGAWWVWLTLVIGGLPGFVAGIGTHFSVGYVDFVHLAPAYLALLLYVAGAALSFPYLVGSRGLGNPSDGRRMESVSIAPEPRPH